MQLAPTWSLWPDSNRRPAHYECAALPTEPHKQLSVNSTDNNGIVSHSFAFVNHLFQKTFGFLLDFRKEIDIINKVSLLISVIWALKSKRRC